KRFRRTMDIKAKKHHIPLVDRNPLEPPPIVVAIVGPPKVGKSTLMHCLIKNFTRQTLSSIQGPVTIVSGKKRRLTFIECNNDINNMIDIAKVADLVLLLIDASFGFEMETFEFLNICQVHGFPRIMGVLTHLDIFKNNKTLRTTKKQLKRRFWTEIYQGAKLFYLSGMVHGDYQKTEIHNLGRFISVMKFRPLSWKQNHPYILSDRMEDLTDPELIRQNPVCDRDICLYGYTRGGHFKNKTSVHIPGCGDFQIHDISFLPDPCPLPDKEKRRSLNEKEKLIYAPMSGVGGIVYDKDAVYIDLGGSHSHSDSKQEEKEESSEGIVGSLIDTQVAIDEKMAVSEMKLFQDSNPLKAEDVEGNSIFQTQTEERILDSGRVRRKAIFLDNEEDEMEVETSGSDDGDDSDEEIIDDNEDLDIVSDEINKRGNDREENIAFADSDDELEVTENARGVSHKTEKKHVRFSDDDPKIDTAEDSALRWKENLKEKAIMSFYQRQADTKNLNKLVYGAHHENHINDDDKSDGTDEIGGLFVISKDKLKSGKTLMNDVDCTQYKTDAIQDWRSSAVMDSIRDCFVTGKWTKSEDAETLIQQDDELFGDFEDLESGPASENNVRDSDHESCDENEKIEAEK
ncbi:BMS1 (predicted), partial [Pycnogonum litorale]